jgi:hypothetical protein
MLEDFTVFNATVWAGCSDMNYRKNNNAMVAGRISKPVALEVIIRDNRKYHGQNNRQDQH